MHILTPDVLLPVDPQCIGNGTVASPLPEYTDAPNPLNGTVNVPGFEDPLYLAWYEAYVEALTVDKGEYDTLLVSRDATSVLALNHYMHNRYPSVSWWWKLGVLGERTRLGDRAAPHVIYPPAIYTTRSRLANIYNRCRLKNDITILDCTRIFHRKDVYTSILYVYSRLATGQSVLVGLCRSVLFDPATPSILYLYTRSFASSHAHYSTCGQYVFLVFNRALKKTGVTMCKRIESILDGQFESIFTTPPTDYVEYTARYATWILEYTPSRTTTYAWLHKYRPAALDPRVLLTPQPTGGNADND